jgi:DNA-binding CsgD family transcriptional regulator
MILSKSQATVKEATAARLMISEKTVSNQRSHLLQKLGFSNVVELVRYAVKNGIVNG